MKIIDENKPQIESLEKEIKQLHEYYPKKARKKIQELFNNIMNQPTYSPGIYAINAVCKIFQTDSTFNKHQGIIRRTLNNARTNNIIKPLIKNY